MGLPEADDLDTLRNQTRMVEDILSSQEGLARRLEARLREGELLELLGVLTLLALAMAAPNLT